MHSAQPALAGQLDSETAVCGWFREPFMFWQWRRLAGSPDPRRLAKVRAIEPVQFKSWDGVVLGGYKLKAANFKGYLLVALGNAMLADQVADDLQRYRDQELDVYVFDYRGYGNSQGKSRLAAIVADYAALVADLNSRGYRKRLLYGISMGGVILSNAVGLSKTYDRLVIDSSPSRISPLGCPERYDPLNHLPEDSSRVMIISGGRDTVVPPAQMDQIIRTGRSRGAFIIQDQEFAHPFQDASQAIHRRRQNEVAAFLLRD